MPEPHTPARRISDERIEEWVAGAHDVLANTTTPADSKLWKSWSYDLADQVLALAWLLSEAEESAADLASVRGQLEQAREALLLYVEQHETFGRHFLGSGEYATGELLRTARAALAAGEPAETETGE